MKKTILIFTLLILLTSCFGKEENKKIINKKVEEKQIVKSFENPKNDLESDINSREENLDNTNKKELLDLAKSYLKYGDAYYNEKTFANKALEILNKMNSEFIVEYLKGYAYEIQTKYQDALKQYNKALSLENITKEQKIEALNQKGHIYDLQGELEKANEYYLEAEKLDGKNIKTMLNRGRYEARIGNNDKAKTYFTNILLRTNIDNLKSEISYNLSTIYSEGGELEKAITYAKRGIRYNKDYPNNYLALGVLYIDMGGDEMKKAPENLKKAIELYPNSSTAYKYLGIYNYIIDNYDEAIRNFEKQVEVSKKDILLMAGEKLKNEIDGNYDLARSYALKGDERKSIEYLNKVLNGDNSPYYYLFISELSNEDGVFNKVVNNDYFDSEVKKIIIKYTNNK